MIALLKLTVLLAVLALLGGVYYAVRAMRHGLTAHDEPPAAEIYLARAVRHYAIPAEARDAQNPWKTRFTPEVAAYARHHFADHCAVCHANDGSGQSEMGQGLYPRSPDLRRDATQDLSDGELYYIIHNGVRWTGMPAWGEPASDMDSWRLVLFIRHLPQLTSDEIHDMERFNPKSIVEQQEEKEEEDFLNGGPAPAAPSSHSPHSEKSK